MPKKNRFTPDWIESAPEKGSYRSIFKYGNPQGFKHPNARLYEELKKTFGLTDDNFRTKETTGNEKVDLSVPSSLDKKIKNRLMAICGRENISFSEYDRLMYSTGQTLEEHMKLRRKRIGRITDGVVHPRNKKEVSEVLDLCHREGIPVYVYGGGTSVNFGFYPEKGGITLVLSTHMNRVIAINETNQTATVEAGILGPALEEILNQAPEKYGCSHRFTCGHFPQSFESSSIGGWIVTLGSGQQSSYYGDAADFILSLEVVTPVGILKTLDYPATATGPKMTDIIKGSEGAFGVVVEVTWKIFRFMPQNRKYFGFIFPDWKSAVEASREISQGEFGMPSVFRISDPEETHHGLKLYGIEGTVFDKFMALRGYKPKERCLFIGTADGAKSQTKNIKREVKRVCRKQGGMFLTSYPARKWESGRYRDPYLKEDLMDYGILIDTLEASVQWDHLHTVHQKVRAFIKNRPQTLCLSHASHFYPQGTNLYFIYIIQENDVDAYCAFQKGIIQTIAESGASLSHHHGVGRMIAPWMEPHLGKNTMNVLKALKKHFDPKGIMNPGSQLGLDM
jgi:alkyldihydroxyacetonephosphate synthase